MKAKTRRVNKEFIERELIPFVLREQGRGFEMTFWARKYTHGSTYTSNDLDGKLINVPACDTVACLGGSCEVILRAKGALANDVGVAEAMGLTLSEADGLFYEWAPEAETHYRWPKAFALKFQKATTKLEKAQVAVALLRHIIDTDAKCLRARKFARENSV